MVIHPQITKQKSSSSSSSFFFVSFSSSCWDMSSLFWIKLENFCKYSSSLIILLWTTMLTAERALMMVSPLTLISIASLITFFFSNLSHSPLQLQGTKQRKSSLFVFLKWSALRICDNRISQLWYLHVKKIIVFRNYLYKISHHNRCKSLKLNFSVSLPMNSISFSPISFEKWATSICMLIKFSLAFKFGGGMLMYLLKSTVSV